MNVKWEALEGKEEDKQIDAILQLHQHIIICNKCTLPVTKIALQTERFGTLRNLGFCNPLETTSVAAAAATTFLITPAQTHVELGTMGILENKFHQNEKDRCDCCSVL
jgi:hypothetical protein